MLSSTASVSLGILFVSISGTNVWLMLRGSRPSQSSDSRARLLRLHRLGGYLFLCLFAVMFFYMNLRVLGVKHGLPIAITLHSALAFLLLPLLLVKVLIARHYKQYSGMLLALGLTIFIVSFLLVSITSSAFMPDTEKIAGTLVFARSHRSCSVPEGRTVLETAEANGIFIPSSCRHGQCGTCAVRAMGGVVRMDTEDGLSPDLKESGYVLTCVGRPEGKVTLDL